MLAEEPIADDEVPAAEALEEPAVEDEVAVEEPAPRTSRRGSRASRGRDVAEEPEPVAEAEAEEPAAEPEPESSEE